MDIYNENGKLIGRHAPTYDPYTESVYCDGVRIYQECGIGEIDLRQVMSGEETFEDGTPFTFEDFLREVLGLRF